MSTTISTNTWIPTPVQAAAIERRRYIKGRIDLNQEMLAAALVNAKQQIEAMEKDLLASYLPRYGGHLLQTATQIQEFCTKINAFNEVV